METIMTLLVASVLLWTFMLHRRNKSEQRESTRRRDKSERQIKNLKLMLQVKDEEIAKLNERLRNRESMVKRFGLMLKESHQSYNKLRKRLREIKEKKSPKLNR